MADIKTGDIVRVKQKPKEPPVGDFVFKVKDVGDDKGFKFACLTNHPDDSGGVFGSYFLEDLELVRPPKEEKKPDGPKP